jgi:hypothetical protein
MPRIPRHKAIDRTTVWTKPSPTFSGSSDQTKERWSRVQSSSSMPFAYVKKLNPYPVHPLSSFKDYDKYHSMCSQPEMSRSLMDLVWLCGLQLQGYCRAATALAGSFSSCCCPPQRRWQTFAACKCEKAVYKIKQYQTIHIRQIL